MLSERRGRSVSAKGARDVRGALRRVSADARATFHAAETPAQQRRAKSNDSVHVAGSHGLDRPSHRRSLIGAQTAGDRARAELTRSSRPRGGHAPSPRPGRENEPPDVASRGGRREDVILQSQILGVHLS